MRLLINLLINSLGVAIAAYLLQPNVQLDSFFTAVIVAIVLGLVNTFIKPIISLLTLPINFLTLGLFSFIINGLLILLVSSIVSGFHVENFLWAMIFSVVLSLISSVLGMLKR